MNFEISKAYISSKHLVSLGVMGILVKSVQCNSETWSDGRAITCEQYKSLNYCKLGSYGPNWRFDVDGLFRDYVDADGFDASDRCCECIPSTSTKFSHLGCNPRNEPDNDKMWVDLAGHSCIFYREHGWCEYFGYGMFMSL